MGFLGPLSAGEMVAQVLLARAANLTDAPAEFIRTATRPPGSQMLNKEQLNQITRYFAAQDKVPYPYEPAPETADAAQLAAGRELFAKWQCVKCHIVAGKLPAQDQLDALHAGASTVFTSVGYGLQRINPVFVEAEKIRMYANPKLDQINTGYTGDFSMLLSNNASTGGTCFGDSGGPNFLGSSNVIAGVTSFGKNGNCAGTGGVFRLDRKDVIDFVSQYLK